MRGVCIAASVLAANYHKCVFISRIAVCIGAHTHCVRNSPNRISVTLRCAFDRAGVCNSVLRACMEERTQILFLDLQWNDTTERKKKYYVLFNAVCYLCAPMAWCCCCFALFAGDNIFVFHFRGRRRRGSRSFSLSRSFFSFLQSPIPSCVLISIVRIFGEYVYA